MAAVAAEELTFWRMTEVQLRQWVEANPERVNDRDRLGEMPLCVAVFHMKSLPLTVWLLDEKGADVNARAREGYTLLHVVESLGILIALLNRGADPTLLNDDGTTTLMRHSFHGRVACVARLLQDPAELVGQYSTS